MYGGDEVGAVVVDMGSSFTKAGFAGEGAPKIMFPSICGVQIGSAEQSRVGVADAAPGEAMDVEARPPAAASSRKTVHCGYAAAFRRDHMEIVQPVRFGAVQDWEYAEQLWDHCFRKQLCVDPKEHPVMIADRAFSTPQSRDKLAQLIFEKFDSPALFLARSSVLAAFALGKTSALVLDCGGGVTSCEPVFDGYVVNRGARRTQVAGSMVDQCFGALLFGKGKNKRLLPRYKVHRQIVPPGKLKATVLDLPNTPATFHDYMCAEVLRDIKETHGKASDVPLDWASGPDNVPKVQYELPDGKMLDIGMERFSAVECLFSGPPPFIQMPEDLDHARSFQFTGMQSLVTASIDACDIDIRKDLYANIVLTGGMSLLPSMSDRLLKDLNTNLSPALKAKVQLPNTTAERRFGVWIGGSILGSLGSFHQMWVSKAEYEEQGDVLFRKCP